MKKIGKYEFANKTTAQDKIKSFGEETKHIFVELGNILIIPGEYDENDNEVVAPVYSELYHVDVLWKDLEIQPTGWANYAADISDNGVHSFMGLDYQLYKF